MKIRTTVFTYLFTLAIGVLLLVFNSQTDLFKWIVVAIGILFMLPSLFAACALMFHKRHNEDGTPASSAGSWALLLTSIGGLIFGLLLVFMPRFFADYIVYTFGVILILSGIASISFLSLISRPEGINAKWIVMPILTIIAGVAVIFIGPHRLENFVVILTGIMLVLYSINGFIASSIKGRQRVKAAKVAKLEESTPEAEKAEQ